MKRIYASRVPTPEPWEEKHTALVRRITAQGMVLLENRHGLPLREGSKVALYGYGARNTAFCGYGAASINSRVQVSIEQGLRDNGIDVTTTAYLDRYEAAMREEEEAYFSGIRAVGGSLFGRLVKMYSEQFTPVAQIPISMEDVENSDTDTALFVITRVSGEGADRKATAGDYGLSEAEQNNLLFLSRNYRHVIVLLNTVGPVDTAFIRRLPNLGALLLVGLNGGVTGSATADVLTGRIVPEGKLTTTWAAQYWDYPNAHTFGLVDGNVDDEVYSEGIYVGYRYFDSFGVQPDYPFGYGLSYTSFSIQTKSVKTDGDRIEVQAEVANTGNTYCGRETLQLYASCPGKRLDQPAQRLIGFAKTGLLMPGQRELVTVQADVNVLSSYDEAVSGWILEAGDYPIRLGNSSRTTKPVAVLRVAGDALLEQCRAFSVRSDIKEPLRPMPEQSIFFGEKLPEDIPVLLWRQTQAPITHDYTLRKEQTQNLAKTAASERFTFRQLLGGQCTTEEMAASLSEDEMIALCVGKVAEPDGNGSSGSSLVCASDDVGGDVNGEVPLEVVVGASYTTAALIDSRMLPNIAMADGGCGIRLLPEFEMDETGKVLTAGISAIKNGEKLLNEEEKKFFAVVPKGTPYWQYTTALPMAAVLAQTWDVENWRICGEIEHREMERFGLKLWLAPGMNIHRNPLCGRNFEYYSEDPLLTGFCAAQVIQGIQNGGGAGTTIKHLACNNQEENRGGMNAQVSERALREIYLKGYEIAVKQAHPCAIMTGHNLVNGVNAAESYDLLTAAAREEWGFDGLVMTDWGTTSKSEAHGKYGQSDCDTCLKAGTDLIMPGTQADLDELKYAVTSGKLDIDDLRWCAWNVLKVAQLLMKE